MHHQHIKPLGLPRGSIRAIIALVVVTVACLQMLNGTTPSLLFAETLMIVLTHYFTVRQQVCIDVSTHNKISNTDAVSVDEAHPLWLPRGSIRIIISLAFMVTVVMLIGQGRLLDSNVLTLLIPFAAYLLGFLFRHKKPTDPAAKPSWWARAYVHLLAILAIIISMILLLLALYNILPTVSDWVASLLLSALLYYFGTK